MLEWRKNPSPPPPHLAIDLSIIMSLNPIQTALFWTFSDRGGGALEAPPPPFCNFKTVDAMVTKLTQDDVDNNSGHFWRFPGMVA